LKNIENTVLIFADSLNAGHKIISCDNGGSHCHAMHFAEEPSGRYRETALPAISDPSHISCMGNDFGFNRIFSRFVQAIRQDGDVLLGISTSGNSANIINAASKKSTSKSFIV